MSIFYKDCTNPFIVGVKTNSASALDAMGMAIPDDAMGMAASRGNYCFTWTMPEKYNSFFRKYSEACP